MVPPLEMIQFTKGLSMSMPQYTARPQAAAPKISLGASNFCFIFATHHYF
jgi:hypothetical protein